MLPAKKPIAIGLDLNCARCSATELLAARTIGATINGRLSVPKGGNDWGLQGQIELIGAQLNPWPACGGRNPPCLATSVVVLLRLPPSPHVPYHPWDGSQKRLPTALMLNAPNVSFNESRALSLDKDQLILSTIHSVKGHAWPLSGLECEDVRGRNRCEAGSAASGGSESIAAAITSPCVKPHRLEAAQQRPMNSRSRTLNSSLRQETSIDLRCPGHQ